jgi:hypothetical protein
VGLAYTRFGKCIMSRIVHPHRPASSLRGERDFDNLTQGRLKVLLQNEQLPPNYLFWSCFFRIAVGLPIIRPWTRCPACIGIHWGALGVEHAVQRWCFNTEPGVTVALVIPDPQSRRVGHGCGQGTRSSSRESSRHGIGTGLSVRWRTLRKLLCSSVVGV